ncbi:helix-turn-helix domain-containing protein [Micromonospora inyonensis]|uniref:Helix-turn-helix n=1 Tax=Micromonospora inyonensis TaxID=47866 RepID=A0A1C6RX33_9ACTN|nr:helix-turn-helix transcriptional regulator [Micromonospora inyonensis]SCL12835.1 Helix-turn-helix [Micromonospora inyonensis]SCL21581.1 Helix-turn-helix [Micromonospora inyonensis]
MSQPTNTQEADWIKRRREVPAIVAKEQRPPNYRCHWQNAYRSPMGDASSAEDWAGYLRRMTRRHGWSVARLARESGINRATIFGWMNGDGVTVANVKVIAKALGDDEAHALAAAGGVEPEEALDPDLRIILRRLKSPEASEAEKAVIRGTLKHLADLADRAERGEEQDRRAS